MNAVLAKLDRPRAGECVAGTRAGSVGVAERAGISLQLSGHTHRGQFFPWTWITKRMYKKFAYGLQKFGAMLVYTSSGAARGTPLRVCSHPEIVLIHLCDRSADHRVVRDHNLFFFRPQSGGLR